jgi:hypothetical protein
LWDFQLGFEQRVARLVAMVDDGRDKVLFFRGLLACMKMHRRKASRSMHAAWLEEPNQGGYFTIMLMI